jgi:signal transduction histidine kinase/ActR/RegA family two-component response regulator
MIKQDAANKIVLENFSRMKYLSIIFVGFAAYALILDFSPATIWNQEHLPVYKILDLIFAAIALGSLVFFWFTPKNKQKQSWPVVNLIAFFVLVWAAIITGIDFTTLGFSTFILVLISSVFFIYLNTTTSIFFYLLSALALVFTVLLHNQLTRENYLPFFMTLLPIVIVSILLSGKNYKNKIKELEQNNTLEQLNNELHAAKQNLETKVEERTHQLISANEELKQTNAELVLARQKAEQSDQLKTVFINNISHEIRTPMNGIMGFAELLDNPDLPVDKRRFYSKIVLNSSWQLLKIIDDILEISTLDTKQVKPDKAPFNLNELLSDLQAVFNIKADQKNISLHLKAALPDDKSYIVSDKSKLHKILSNLLENAFKFTPGGQIEFGYFIANQLLSIYVKDTGVGIAPENIDLVFERFAQESESLSINPGGLGIGLSIVKENAHLLGGTIRLESEKGKGSTFTLTLPYEVAAPKESLNKAPETFAGFEKNYTILIAEDEDSNFHYLQALLKDNKVFQCNLIHARNGQEAIEKVASNKNIHMILMDMRMPVMDGFDATRHIKKENPEIPIIAQSAYSTENDQHKIKQAGCDDFIAKPINKNDLLKKIFHFLHQAV